jgi:trigger factor
MNITTEQKAGGTMVMTVTVAETDYAAEVAKRLKEYRRKANVPGFRPGMVPMGIINKMYRRGVVAEQAYRIASEEMYKYLEDNKIEFMGDPIASEEQGEFDFESDTTHTFKFDVGVAPAVDITLGTEDKLTYYKIKIDKGMRDNWRSNFMRRFGRLEDVDKVTKDEALEVSLDNGTLHVDDAYIGLVSLSDEERKQFKGKKVGDSMIVDINEIYKTPQQSASILGVEQSELASIQPEFTATITKIRRFVEPALDEEFFKTAFPDGTVTDEAGFVKYGDEQIGTELTRESDYMLSVELRNYLLKKADLAMPEDFLRRWLFVVNEGKFTEEEIDRDFPAFLKLMAWSRIQNHYIDTLGIKIEQEDMLAEAKKIAQMQFAQYGMSQVPDDTLASYAQSILSSKDEAQRIFERVREDKVVEAVKGTIKITNKSVSVEEFQKVAGSIV